MPGRVNLEISLFGAFRKYAGGVPLQLAVPEGTTLDELRDHLRQAIQSRFPTFDQPSLIDESALADERNILAPDYTCTCDAALALLPPVCGG